MPQGEGGRGAHRDAGQRAPDAQKTHPEQKKRKAPSDEPSSQGGFGFHRSSGRAGRGWAGGEHMLPTSSPGTAGNGGDTEPRGAPQGATHSSGLPRPPRLCHAERPRQARLLRFSCFLKEKKIPRGTSASQTRTSQRHRSGERSHGHTVTQRDRHVEPGPPPCGPHRPTTAPRRQGRLRAWTLPRGQDAARVPIACRVLTVIK